ncbi:uncharacterized protein LOC110844942 isoform X2 [Folsomia candida]|uniref:uncharacterized protein LOC110844942 isoform X2 n=1 Tax=Folsomia candida TaxID=158441 RepID=UPI0016054341|nr:uncharacterized protein LOC110844942 isoform X2 [Folsomia candida]
MVCHHNRPQEIWPQEQPPVPRMNSLKIEMQRTYYKAKLNFLMAEQDLALEMNYYHNFQDHGRKEEKQIKMEWEVIRAVRQVGIDSLESLMKCHLQILLNALGQRIVERVDTMVEKAYKDYFNMKGVAM